MFRVELLAKKKPNDRHWYAYDVLLNGETIVSNSHDPEHDLARALLARGIKGVAEVIDGKTGKPRSRVNIERAAKWCVGSNLERYKFRPLEIADSSPPAGENVFADGRAIAEDLSLTHAAIEPRPKNFGDPDARSKAA